MPNIPLTSIILCFNPVTMYVPIGSSRLLSGIIHLIWSNTSIPWEQHKRTASLPSWTSSSSLLFPPTLPTCYKLQATCYHLPPTCYLPSTTYYILLATCYLPPTTYYLQLTTTYQPLNLTRSNCNGSSHSIHLLAHHAPSFSRAPNHRRRHHHRGRADIADQHQSSASCTEKGSVPSIHFDASCSPLQHSCTVWLDKYGNKPDWGDQGGGGGLGGRLFLFLFLSCLVLSFFFCLSFSFFNFLWY